MDKSTDTPPDVVQREALPNSVTRPFRRKCTSGTMAESVKGTYGTCKWMGNFGSRSHAQQIPLGPRQDTGPMGTLESMDKDRLDCTEPPGSTMTPYSNN